MRTPKTRTAFTLVELLVVIAITGILAALLLPTLGRAKQKGMSARCISNLKQLQTAWQMYADDNDDSCVPNKSRRTNGFYRGYPATWAGESSAEKDTTDDELRQGAFVRLGYIDGTGVFRCPADRGTSHGAPVTRSYGLSAHFAGGTNAGTNVIFYTSEVKNPTEAFTFIDEHEDTIDDGHFLVWRAPDTRWTNLPADRHGNSGVLAFMDGHVEQWTWKGRKRFVGKAGTYWMDAVDDLPDLRRLQAALPEKM